MVFWRAIGMPSQVHEDVLDLSVGLLEAQVPPEDTSTDRASYPLPRLEPLDRRETRRFRCLVLENRYLRVHVVPGLGGRILRIHDRRTAKEILAGDGPLAPRRGGVRGAFLSEGIQVRLRAEDRLGALAEVSSLTEDPEDDEAPARVWIGEIDPGSGLSYHAVFSLPPDRAEIQIEVRVFNRTMHPVPYNAGLAVHRPGGTPLEFSEEAGEAVAWLDAERGVGLALIPGGQPLEGRFVESDRLALHRFQAERALAARQLDTWSVRVVPITDLKGLHAVSADAALHLEMGNVRLQASTPILGGKLLLLTSDGQTLEVPVDLHPGRLVELALPDSENPPAAIVLRDAAKGERLRWEPGLEPQALERVAEAPVRGGGPALDDERAGRSERELLRETFEPGERHLPYLALGRKALAEGRHEEAATHLESSLLFNAEDHLAWFLKALADRLAGNMGDERPELLNAHFLAPLEPALRAEGFLSQGGATREASPLLRPLLETPEAFVEVAAILLEAGLHAEATRWLDESLRQIDLAMLRYLQAFAYLEASRMRVEAAEHVAAAAKLPFGPPFPWRPIERKALARLLEAFPEDARLGAFGSLATKNCQYNRSY
jgi:hypothetical protein